MHKHTRKFETVIIYDAEECDFDFKGDLLNAYKDYCQSIGMSGRAEEESVDVLLTVEFKKNEST